MFLTYAVLPAQEHMGTLERIAQECELLLTLVQTAQILMPHDGTAVHLHA